MITNDSTTLGFAVFPSFLPFFSLLLTDGIGAEDGGRYQWTFGLFKERGNFWSIGYLCVCVSVCLDVSFFCPSSSSSSSLYGMEERGTLAEANINNEMDLIIIDPQYRPCFSCCNFVHTFFTHSVVFFFQKSFSFLGLLWASKHLT